MMKLDDILNEKGDTIYRLSKISGISKTKLFDIFSGKSNILDCRLRVVSKLSKILLAKSSISSAVKSSNLG